MAAAGTSAMSTWLRKLIDPEKNWLAAQHMKSLSNSLRQYGLRYEDLFDPMEDLDIKEALSRLPREVVDARNQRLKRALDLSMKHHYLDQNLQVKRENAEREALGALPLYQRSLP